MTLYLLKRGSGKGGEDEASFMNGLVVVSAQLVFLFWGPATKRLLDVAVGVLTADHEADLAGWVGWDGGVCVLDRGENLLAILLELGDQWEVEPLVFGWDC